MYITTKHNDRLSEVSDDYFSKKNPGISDSRLYNLFVDLCHTEHNNSVGDKFIKEFPYLPEKFTEEYLECLQSAWKFLRRIRQIERHAEYLASIDNGNPHEITIWEKKKL